MYWHRLHQFEGILFCEKHGVQLEESGVSLANIKKSLIPASFALKDIYEKTLDDVAKQTRTGNNIFIDKNAAICRDISWLMENGDVVNGIKEIVKRYETLLAKKNVVQYDNEMIEDLQTLKSMARDYHGKDYLKELHIQVHEYFEWDSAPTIIAKFLTPLQHVLMMEFFCGSAEEFCKQAV